jgi:uncharacterized membrane protein YoaK (UPF0700 family)
MDSSASSAPGIALPAPPEDPLGIALLLAFIGGYLDAYTWIVHGVMANAQTANLVLLRVHGTTGRWEEAWPFVTPMLAFAAGIVLLLCERKQTRDWRLR